jgi:hypothetical protein
MISSETNAFASDASARISTIKVQNTVKKYTTTCYLL